MPHSRQLVWCGPVFEPTGYADEGRELLAALDRAGVHVALRPSQNTVRGFADQLPRAMRSVLDRQMARSPEAGFVLAQHLPADGFVATRAAFNVGRTMFETDSLPPHWVTACNAMDELWLTSQFNIDSFRRAGVSVPMHRVPGGIDCAMFNPRVQPLALADARGTVFLGVLEWRQRKGWDVLLRAWAQAFTPADDVTLVLRTSKNSRVATSDDGAGAMSGVDETINEFFRSRCEGKSRVDVAPIVLLRDMLPPEVMPSLYTAAHAFVAPTRGEGWGRPFMEAMACEVPVIATRWSAHLEYMHDENSLLLDVERVGPTRDADASIYAGQQWAEPSVSHLVSLLQRVHHDRTGAKAIGARARQDMVAHWPWSAAASAIKQRMRDISAQLGSRRVFAGVGPAAEVPQTTLVAALFGAARTTFGLDALAGALAERMGDRLAIETTVVAPLRPSFSSPSMPAWNRSRVAQVPMASGFAPPGQSVPDVTLTCLDDSETPSLAGPPRGRWILMTGDCVRDHVPAHLVRTLRDEADDVWVRDHRAMSACLTAGVSSERLWTVPFGCIADQCTPHGARYAQVTDADASCAGVQGGCLFLLLALAEADRVVAETIVRVWQRAMAGRNAALRIVLPSVFREGEAWCDDWCASIAIKAGLSGSSSLNQDIGFERFPDSAEKIPALLRSAQVVIDASSPTIVQGVWHASLATARPIVAIRTLDAIALLGDADEALVPAGASRGMNGKLLAETLVALCDQPTRDAIGNAARARAMALPSWSEAARHMVSRIAAVQAHPYSRADVLGAQARAM